MAENSRITRYLAALKRFSLIYGLAKTAWKRLRSTPVELLRSLLPASRHFGPPKGFYSGCDMVRNRQLPGEIIFDSQAIPSFPEDSLVHLSRLRQDRHQPWPLFWIRIENAYLSGRTLCPRNERGLLMAESTFSQSGDHHDPAYHHMATGSGEYIQGNATSIVSHWGGDSKGNQSFGGANLWHWLFDSVSRLALLDRFPGDTQIITPRLEPWMRWFLDELGLSGRILETSSSALTVEHLYFASASSMTGCCNPYAVAFLRDRFLPKTSTIDTPRRFYIIREGFTRGVVNESELREFLRRRGWSLIAPEKLTIPDQIALFKNAEAVIGIHGSALTNLLWSSPGSTAIELVAENFMAGAFEWVARQNGVRHDFLICPADHRSCIKVDLELLEAKLSCLGV
jgi:hypothetical protein